MNNIIEIKSLNKIYNPYKLKKVVALDNLFLEIPNGTIFGLLGSNGAGKSTLINIIAGLTKKTSGSIRVLDLDLEKKIRLIKSFIGVVPQELNFDPFLSPRESLEIQAGLYGVKKKYRRTNEILKALDLFHKADTYSRTLSGGMKRRLLIGKALVHTPKILILDEPTAGVDVELRELLWNYIKKLNENGTTIILTTHYLEEAQALCDRIGIIDKGKLVSEGKTKDLLYSLDKKTLIIKTSKILKTMPEVPKNILINKVNNNELIFTYAPSEYNTQTLIDICYKNKIQIKEISSKDVDLQDVFLSAIKRNFIK